jgi:tRNA threonylcarbamoyladenosine biosynthesis protein TsaB
MSENWLILETSGKVGKVGLARGGAVVQSRVLDDSRRHARDLAPTIDAILRDEALAPGDLTGVMVGRGPGSYTGLRVGIMSAKALAYATRCDFRAVDTFAAIALQAPAEANDLWVIADALQGKIYHQHFRLDAGAWKPGSDLRIDLFDDWLAGAAAASWLSGPGVAAVEERIPPGMSVVAEPFREPRVESVFAVGIERSSLARAEMLVLEPLYLRASSAEEKAREK